MRALTTIKEKGRSYFCASCKRQAPEQIAIIGQIAPLVSYRAVHARRSHSQAESRRGRPCVPHETLGYVRMIVSLLEQARDFHRQSLNTCR